MTCQTCGTRRPTINGECGPCYSVGIGAIVSPSDLGIAELPDRKGPK